MNGHKVFLRVDSVKSVQGGEGPKTQEGKAASGLASCGKPGQPALTEDVTAGVADCVCSNSRGGSPPDSECVAWFGKSTTAGAIH